MAEHDLVIRGGNVVDGTGAPARTADVAVDDGVITEVGHGRRHGAGASSTPTACSSPPGWVDIHTHYDGQVTWDPELTPSSWHGVTTVVMGNCGVGFAPVRPGGEEFLIELMEGVEDIPGTALHEGIDWEWETFPEYLDALDAHAARARRGRAGAPRRAAGLRDGRAGPRRGHTPTRSPQMAAVVEAGAAGRRRRVHHLAHHPAQLQARPGARHRPRRPTSSRAGRRRRARGARRLRARRRRCRGRQPRPARGWSSSPSAPAHRDLLPGPGRVRPRGLPTALGDADGDGRRRARHRPPGVVPAHRHALRPAVVAAPVHHPPDVPRAWPTCRSPSGSPSCASPRCAPRCWPRSRPPGTAIAVSLMPRWDQIFPLGDPPDYEPPPSTSVAAVAARDGPHATGGRARLAARARRRGVPVRAAGASYVDGDHEAIREMIDAPAARCWACPTAAPTAASSATPRCPRTCSPTGCATARGASASALEQAVHLQTGRTAAAYGLHRPRHARRRQAGRPQPHRPRRACACTRRRWCSTCPAGGRRLVQRVDGYVATVVAGEVTFENGEPTGARPGRLVRA